MILVIDHGYGNIGSLNNALDYLGLPHHLIKDGNTFSDDLGATGFILPGVGTFDEAMSSLQSRKLDIVINRLHNNGVRGLGICLGMQLLCEGSDEGGSTKKGLSFFKGNVKKLNPQEGFVPNIGWSNTNPTEASPDLLKTILNNAFYYIHSYAFEPTEPNEVIATYKRGCTNISSAIYKNNLMGVQFHPEKSQKAGLSLIQNYFVDQPI